MLVLCGCTSTHFDYAHLPAGYGWRAVYDSTSHAVVFYGRDPYSRETVYVGPDGQFYIFDHPGEIRRDDLKREWTPHDASSL